MKYCVKTVVVLPDTVEETKEKLIDYLRDCYLDDNEIAELIGDIKTWEDVRAFLTSYDVDELYALAPWFSDFYNEKVIERE